MQSKEPGKHHLILIISIRRYRKRPEDIWTVWPDNSGEVRKINVAREDSVSKSLKKRIGSDELIKLKYNYYNKQLENVVLDRLRVERYIETDSRIIQKYDPGYMIPLSKSGRAHFYAPYKLIGDIKIDTYWFNLIVLWLAALAWYAALYFNLLQKLVGFIENVKIKNSEK